MLALVVEQAPDEALLNCRRGVEAGYAWEVDVREAQERRAGGAHFGL